jgi:dTDP-4-amino-4,6-dideoxygalactose transaminase
VARALHAAIADGSWGKYFGPHVELLPQRLAEFLGVPHALACCSGTFAVELSLRVLGVGPGDEVMLAAYDYPANMLGAAALGALPVLIDVDPQSCQLAVEHLDAARSPRTRAVIVSHLHGGLVAMPRVMAWAGAHGIAVVEDAAQAPGAIIAGRRAGAWGDVGVWSFGGSKLLSAGRGGAVFTRRDDVRHRLQIQCRRAGNEVYPLSELQAAALLPQLAKLDEQNDRRARNVADLLAALRDVPGLRAVCEAPARGDAGAPDLGQRAFYKLGFWFDAAEFRGLSREQFVRAMSAEGLPFDAGFPAGHVSRSPKRFRHAGDLQHAGRAHESIVLLHHPILLGSADEIGQVAAAVRRVYDHAPDIARLGGGA